MINVTESTKNAYKGSSSKDISIRVYNGSVKIATLTSNDIISESLHITAGIEAQEYLSFTGCIATTAEFDVLSTSINLKGKYIVIELQAGSTEKIALFRGYVDSQAVTNQISGSAHVVAYDELYRLSTVNIADWYNNLFSQYSKRTIAQIRASLFSYLNLDVATTTLINDDIQIYKQYSPTQLSALDFIKALCAFNGVFGRMCYYPSEKFEFKSLEVIPDEFDPTEYEQVPYYKDLKFEQFTTHEITKVLVRQDDTSEISGVYGTDGSTYVLQGNLFTFNLSESALTLIAQRLYNKVSSIKYRPYTATQMGYPWVECGDVVCYQVYDYNESQTQGTNVFVPMCFYVLNKEQVGVGALFDTISAAGDEYQTEFVTNMSLNLDNLRNRVDEISGKLNSLESAAIYTKVVQNNASVSISENTETTITDLSYEVTSENNLTMVTLTAILDTTATETESSGVYTLSDIVSQLRFYVDNVEVALYRPQFVMSEGKDSLTVTASLPSLTVGAHNFKVKLLLTGATATVGQYDAHEMLMGYGISFDVYLKTLTVLSQPNRTVFYRGEKFDYTGLEIQGTYNTDATQDFTDLCSYTPPNGSDAYDYSSDYGIVQVRAEYENVDTSFNVEVKALFEVAVSDGDTNKVFEETGNNGLSRPHYIKSGNDIYCVTVNANRVNGNVYSTVVVAVTFAKVSFDSEGVPYVSSAKQTVNQTFYTPPESNNYQLNVSVLSVGSNLYIIPNAGFYDYKNDTLQSMWCINLSAGTHSLMNCTFTHTDYPSATVTKFIYPDNKSDIGSRQSFFYIDNHIIFPRITLQYTNQGQSYTDYGWAYATISNNTLDISFVEDNYINQIIWLDNQIPINDSNDIDACYNNSSTATYCFELDRDNSEISIYSMSFDNSNLFKTTLIGTFTTQIDLSTSSYANYLRYSKCAGANMYCVYDVLHNIVGVFNPSTSMYTEKKFDSTEEAQNEYYKYRDAYYNSNQGAYFTETREQTATLHYLKYSRDISTAFDDWSTVEGQKDVQSYTTGNMIEINNNYLALADVSSGSGINAKYTWYPCMINFLNVLE